MTAVRTRDPRWEVNGPVRARSLPHHGGSAGACIRRRTPTSEKQSRSCCPWQRTEATRETKIKQAQLRGTGAQPPSPSVALQARPPAGQGAHRTGRVQSSDAWHSRGGGCELEKGFECWTHDFGQRQGYRRQPHSSGQNLNPFPTTAVASFELSPQSRVEGLPQVPVNGTQWEARPLRP